MQTASDWHGNTEAYHSRHLKMWDNRITHSPGMSKIAFTLCSSSSCASAFRYLLTCEMWILAQISRSSQRSLYKHLWYGSSFVLAVTWYNSGVRVILLVNFTQFIPVLVVTVVLPCLGLPWMTYFCIENCNRSPKQIKSMNFHNTTMAGALFLQGILRYLIS